MPEDEVPCNFSAISKPQEREGRKKSRTRKSRSRQRSTSDSRSIGRGSVHSVSSTGRQGRSGSKIGMGSRFASPARSSVVSGNGPDMEKYMGKLNTEKKTAIDT